MQDTPEFDEPPSKTQRKRDMVALQAIGAELIALNDQQLAGIEMPENLLAAVTEARRLHPHEARRRQLQYIGKLMRNIDPAPIRAGLDSLLSASAEHTARLHLIERWRERLLADPQAVAEFINEFPAANSQQLRTLIRNTGQERERGKPPKHFRALFQMIRELSEGRDRDHEAAAQSSPKL